MKNFLLTAKSAFFFLLFVSHVCSVQAAPPTAASHSISYSSVEGNGFSITFTRGDGLNRIVVVRKNEAVSFLPVHGSSYTASEFGTGTPVGAGEYVVYNGPANSVTISGLAPNSLYHVAIFEYNGTGSTTEYLLSPLRGNRHTAVTPTTAAVSVTTNTMGGNFLRLGVVSGSGDRRLVLMRKGGPVTSTPADLTTYWVGSEIGAGNKVVYNGNTSGNPFDVSNLTTSTDYYFAVFEYNGMNKPVYQTIPPTTAKVTTNPRPTVNSTNLVTEAKEGDRISIRYKLGNGAARIVVARQGQPVSALPVDGTTYTGNLSFGGTGSSNLGDGQFVVYNGFNVNDAGSNSMTITSLPRNTTYHFAIYEYDYDANGKPVYLTTNPATVSGSTHDEPTMPAKDMSFEGITDKYATVKFKAGNGTGRLLICRKDGPVNVTPTDLNSPAYSPSLGYGAVLNGDNHVVAESGESVTVQRLQSSTEYHFAVFEYNGYFGRLYLDANPARGKMTTAVRPTLGASSMNFSNIDGNSIKLSWNNGNGKGRVIVARKGAAVTATAGEVGDLKDNRLYAADARFGLGAQIKPGEFVVYNDSVGMVETRNSCTVTGLEGNTLYHFAVYEYGRRGEVLQFATASPATATNVLLASSFTARPPTSSGSSFTVTAFANRTVSLSWNPGGGEMRILLAKAGSPVDAVPVDLTNYTADDFGKGSQIGNGNFVVYKGKGNTCTVNGLQPGVTYHFTLIEANGNLAPVFQNTVITTPLTGSRTTVERPTTAPKDIAFSNVTQTGFTINWTRGNGAKSLVIMRAVSNPTVKPVDGQAYTANPSFGSGIDISPDGTKQYVVYNGDKNAVDVTGLQPGETYLVNVFEYEEPQTLGTAYLTAQFATGFKQIIGAPLSQAAALKAKWMNGETIKLDWESGSGQRRIVVAREGAAVNGLPTDNATYSANSQFGSGQQVGTGNYVVYNGSGNTTNVSHLKPTKTYHFTLYEFNQFGAATLYHVVDPAKTQITIPNLLPVTWLDFTAVHKGNEVLLEWKTTAEVKNKEFEIERTIDGVHFGRIGIVRASSQSLSVHTYNFTDAFPANRTAHYRLKQIDIDGNFSYSKTVQAKGEESSLLQIVENPVRDQVRIRCGSSLTGSKIMIADAGGRTVYNGTVSRQMLMIPTNHLPAGMYYVKAIQVNGNSITASFLHN